MNVIFLSAILGIVFMLRSVFTKEATRRLWLDFTLIGGGIVLLFFVNLVERSLSEGLRFYPFSEGDLMQFIDVDAGVLNAECIAVLGVGMYFLFMARKIGLQVYAMETVALIFFCLVGIGLMMSFNNLLTLFLAVEIFSLPQYVLAGSRKHQLESLESSFKYFLMGAFFSAILLFGIALMFGASGTLSFGEMYANVAQQHHPVLFYAGVILVLVSLLFKAGIAPFHFWVPDVYMGAPDPVLPFIAGISKIGMFIFLFRFFSYLGVYAMEGQYFWMNLISILIAVSLIVANFSALRQTSTKRMIAYSGIAQGAYMLFSLLDPQKMSYDGLLIFTFGYALALIGIFYVIVDNEEEKTKGKEQEESFLRGLAQRKPLQSAMLTVCLFSLAGIPGTAGFLGKFYMLRVGATYGNIGLVVVAAVCSAISLYYYLKVVKQVYFSPVSDASIATTHESKEHSVVRFLYVVLMLALVLVGFGYMPHGH